VYLRYNSVIEMVGLKLRHASSTADTVVQDILKEILELHNLHRTLSAAFGVENPASVDTSSAFYCT